GLAAFVAGLLLCGARSPDVLLAAALAAAGLALARTPGLGVIAAAVLVAGAVAGHARLTTIDASSGFLHPGQRFAGHAWLLERPRRSATASFDYPAYLRRCGIQFELELDRLRSGGPPRGGLQGTVDWMRSRSERGVASGLSRGDGALAMGMVLGEDQRLASD